jgi:outer membrane protein assembly factor BamD (BamD/ComL family)
MVDDTFKTLVTTGTLIATGTILLLTGGGCASISTSPSAWHLPSLEPAPALVGTPEWWKKHKKESVLVPKKGFQVEGVEGYFDQEGRPIHAQVAKVVDTKDSDDLLGEIPMADQVAELKARVGMGPDQKIAQEAMVEGETLFSRKDYRGAAKQFEKAIARWPGSRLEQDALFQLAESQFFDNDYPDAVDSYDRLMQKYPNTSHLDKVIRRQFDIARYWEEYHQYRPHWATTPNLLDDTRPIFDTLGRSLKIYENIRLNDPTGPLADDAIMATANSHFLRGRYEDADYHYALIRRDYPRSEHQFEAHLLGLQSKLRLYQGAEYDGTSLEEAKRLIKQLKMQFAGDLNKSERERLLVEEAKLNQQLMMREMKMATYYDETGHAGSARFYYGNVIRKYPESELSANARERLTALADSPEHPETNFAWFINLFPQNAERTAIAQVPMVGDSNTRIALASGEEEADGNSDASTITR